MAKYEYGDMFSVWNEADVFMITTNSTLKKNGALVMGAGIAKQIRDRFKGIDRVIGAMIKNTVGHMGLYGILLGDWKNKKKLGLFQVKYDWSSEADLKIIRYSTEQLKIFAEEHPEINIHLNYPGIGNGKLDKLDVEKVISVLPDNVTIWEYQ